MFLESRHACEQGDGLASYTWTEYDPRDGGVQVIKDPMNNVQITTELLFIEGGDHGGSWAARIKGEPLDPGQLSKSSCSRHVADGTRRGSFQTIPHILLWRGGTWRRRYDD